MSVIATKATRLSRRSNGIELSSEEFDAVTKWDPAYRYELIHGVVIVSPIPAEGEARPNDELAFLLRFYAHQHPSGGVIDATLPERYVHLADGSRRRADRVIWVGLGRLPDYKLDPPTIAIEFDSQSKRDRVRDYETKRREYRGAGIMEYWIIDRFRRTMTVSLADGSERVLVEGETYQSQLLPGFELPLQTLLRIAGQRGPFLN